MKALGCIYNKHERVGGWEGGSVGVCECEGGGESMRVQSNGMWWRGCEVALQGCEQRGGGKQRERERECTHLRIPH